MNSTRTGTRPHAAPLLVVAGLACMAGVATSARGQHGTGGARTSAAKPPSGIHTSVSKPPAAAPTDISKSPGGAEPRYLLFWTSPERASGLATRVGERGDGRARLLGFGVPCSTFVQEKQVAESIRRAFVCARKFNLAVMLQFDFHVEWSNRPDLWNWFDPTKAGYNPANRENVEWFDWDGPPARARYLNWGEVQRLPPPICFTSRAVRAEWTRLIRDVIVPPLNKELLVLKHERRGQLFAGILVGSEPTFDDYSHTDPQTALRVAADGAPTGQLGYRGLLDRGFSRDHRPADIHRALGEIIQETVAFWCKAFVSAGLPARKLYPHIPAGASVEMTSAPVGAAFNGWSRPGWSTYPTGTLEQNFQPLYDALKKHGSPPWGGIEANAGAPGALIDWESYLAWHFNHGAMVVAINTGATGSELPARLEQSAFGAQALAAYGKFLRGERLQEIPISADLPQMRIRRKMESVQAGFRRWQAAGRDPAPIGRMVEERLPALLNANRLAEAETVLDNALKLLNQNDGPIQ